MSTALPRHLRVPKRHLAAALLFVPGVYLMLVVCLGLVAATALFLIWLWIGLVEAIENWATIVIFYTLIPLGLASLGAVLGVGSMINGLIHAMKRPWAHIPAIPLSASGDNRLYEFIVSTCKAVGTGLPHAVLLSVTPEFSVLQGKVVCFGAYGKGRILVMSLPLIHGLRTSHLRSILVHEFAHFSGGDTVYSRFVEPVYRGTMNALASMQETILLSRSGMMWLMMSIPFRIPYYLLLGYLKLFDRVNMRISRRRELRADYISAMLCGTRTFRQALERTEELETAYAMFCDSVRPERRRHQGNGRDFFAEFGRNADALARAAEKLHSPPSPEVTSVYSPHPLTRQRLAAVPEFPDKFEDDGPATALFNHLDDHGRLLSQCMVRGPEAVFAINSETWDCRCGCEGVPKSQACPSCGLSEEKGFRW